MNPRTSAMNPRDLHEPAASPDAADPAAADPAAADPAAGPVAAGPAAAVAAVATAPGEGYGAWWGAVPGGSPAAMAAADAFEGDWQAAAYGPAAAAAADAFEGDWQAAAYGPAAGEVAGRLRLWMPLADGADPSTWPAQVVLVAGFGAERTS